MKHSAKQGRTGWAEKQEGGKANAGQRYPIIDTHTLFDPHNGPAKGFKD